MSRIDSVRIAALKAADMPRGGRRGTIPALGRSDASSFADSLCRRCRATAVISAGGSLAR
jgi:hypothetical protein